MKHYILLVLGLQAALGASAAESGCFYRHFAEAIALNRARRPLYAALSGGRSLKVSDSLIAFEKASLLAARFGDRDARSFQQAGVPVLCDDFVSMDLVPAFRERAEAPAPLMSYHRPSSKRILREALAAYHQGSFAGLALQLERELAMLEEQPTYNCLMRHFLESARRSALLVPRYRQAASAAGLASPEGISRRFIETTLASTVFAEYIDQAAAPLQAQGLPIVCQDIPPVSVPE